MENTLLNSLYQELLAMKEDLEERLLNQQLSPYVKQMAEEELHDIVATIKKIEDGEFGVCEETGTSIPLELLSFQPNVRSISEVNSILKYFKKPVFPPYQVNSPIFKG